jgi:DNA-binding beta-propeller fold protein YncE
VHVLPTPFTQPRSALTGGAFSWIPFAKLLASNTVIKMDKSGPSLGEFPVGNMPGGLAFDGNSIWVANYFDNTY